MNIRFQGTLYLFGFIVLFFLMRSNMFFWSAIWLLTPNFNSLSHYQGDKLAQAMLITVLVSMFDLKATGSLETSLRP